MKIERGAKMKTVKKELFITLHEQEREGNSKFNSQIVMTAGLKATLENQNIDPILIVKMIMKTIQTIKNKDYFQVATINNMKIYIIDSIDYITFLLPNEY